MAIINNRNSEYIDENGRQRTKEISVKESKRLVQLIQEQVKPYVRSCIEYEPDEHLRIAGAPAVKVNEKLVIAPDLKCVTETGKIFWIEVKDKCQRAYFPDTGADLHQVLGWYDIQKYLNEPVFLVFKDASFDECIPKKELNNKSFKENYMLRWQKYLGKPYGNWLSKCLEDGNSGYPKLFKEHTRDQVAYICYFNINIFNSINSDSWIEVVEKINSNSVPLLRKKFDIKSDEKLIRELAVSTMSVQQNFGDVINFGKFKGKKWEDVDEGYLEWIIFKSATNEDNKRYAKLELNKRKK